MTTPPNPPSENPPADPVDKVLMFRRTIAPMAWSLIVGLFAEWGWTFLDWFDDKPMTLAAVMLALAVLIYAVAIFLGPRLPWLEKVLLSSAERPAKYVNPQAPTPTPTPEA